MIVKELPKAVFAPPSDEAIIRHYGGDAPGARADLSPDGNLMVIAGPGRDLLLVDLKTSKVRKLAIREANIHRAIFVRDGKQVLGGTGAPKGTLFLYGVKEGEKARLFAQADVPLGWTFLALSPDKRHVAAGATDESARLWNLDTGQQEKKYQLKKVAAGGAFAPDGLSFSCGGSDPDVWITRVDVTKDVKAIQYINFPYSDRGDGYA